MNYLIIGGGEVDYNFAGTVIKKGGFDVIIAVDAGMEFLYVANILPDVIIGDFDSVHKEAFEYFKSQPQIEICSLHPEKDDTDTEHAIHYAIAHGASNITILGGTGKRLDHLLGNIALLGIGLEESVAMELLDGNNRIRMTDQSIKIPRERQFGKYLSLIPYSGSVKDVTLKGLKYSLDHEKLGGFNARGISNEIVEEEAVIEFSDGIMLVIESRD